MGAAVTELKNVEEALGLRRGWKNFQVHPRTKDVKGEISDGNKEQIIRNWRKGDPCYKVAKTLC